MHVKPAKSFLYLDQELPILAVFGFVLRLSTKTYFSAAFHHWLVWPAPGRMCLGKRPLTLHHLGGAVMPTLHGGSAVCPPLHGCCSSTSCSACSAFSLVPTSWRPHWFALTHTLYITCAHKLASMFRICGTCDQIVQLITFTHITVV